MSTLQQYKCPCCDGAIEFDSKAQKMVCPFCDTEFDVETLASYDNDLKSVGESDMKWDTAAGSEWLPGEEEGLRVYLCRSCGGEIIGDETLAATACPFCDNPVVMKCQFRGELKPDYVIPFKHDKKSAVEALKKHFLGKRLLPKAFKNENHIDEVKGVYVPVWLFDAKADAAIRYKATRVSMWSDSNYDYTKTSFYSVFRGGNLSFARVPVDGSTKMDDKLMESIEPYNFEDAVDFQTAYLAGYLADKYDVSSEDSIDRADERIKASTEKAFSDTVMGYHTVSPEATMINLSDSSAKYALYPVWLLNTSWNGERYYFAMNGQTGKLVGDLPMDKGAYARWLLGLTGIASAALLALMYLFWLL